MQHVVFCLQSIAAGQNWKAAYEHTAKAVAARAPKPWSFDVSSVFNFVDAFKERCRYCVLTVPTAMRWSHVYMFQHHIDPSSMTTVAARVTQAAIIVD